MRILFVNEKCGYFGGVEQNVAVTAQGLRSKGHQCFLAYGMDVQKDSESYKSLFDRVFLCHEICLLHDKNDAAQPFDEIVNSVSPDVLYLHKISQTDFCLPFLSRIRILRMVHDHDLCCPRRHKYFFHNERICHSRAGWRCYLDLAFLTQGDGSKKTMSYVSIPDKLREMRRNYNLDRLLVGSRFMKGELVQNGFPESRVSIVPPVVPMKPGNISPVSPEPIVLCVAQLIKGKGVDLLLDALKLLDCDFQAIIVGTGNAESYLKNLSRDLGLEKRVHFQGWVDNVSISEFYSKARVVAVPCRWAEPFGMIGLEAMHHGRPVVAFDVGGIPDWLENDVTGLLVPERDVTGLAKSLERLLLDRELASRLGEMAVLRVNERFSFEDYLEQIERHLSG